MTKNDIAVELCKRIPDLPKSTALHVVEGVTDILSDAFVRGDNVYLRGFGSLEVKTTKEKKARNINAGSIAAAHETLVQHMNGTIADYEIATLDDTRIMDVYVYSADGTKSVGVKAANMKQTPEAIIDKAFSGTRTREEVEEEFISIDDGRPMTTLDPEQPYGEDDEG